MKPTPFDPPPVLLAVRDVHEEIHAGLGQTSLTVRTLDGVTLHIRAGELVVLRGGVASGAPSLLAALAGVRRPRSGLRHLARGVQIRRASISDEAFAAIAAAWARPGTPERPLAPEPPPVTRVVYVFRVRAARAIATSPRGPARATPRPRLGSHTRTLTRDTVDSAAWQVWAESLRVRGGSIVAHVNGDVIRGPGRTYARRSAKRTSPAVHEATAGERDSYGASGRSTVRETLRTVTLDAGRIVSAGPATHPTWSGSSTDS